MANQQQIETLVGEALQQAGATDNVILETMVSLSGGLSTLFATDDALVNQNVRTWTKFNQVDDVVNNVVQKVATALWSDSTSSLQALYSSSTQSGSVSGQYYLDVYHKTVGSEGSAVQFSLAYGHHAGSGSGTSTTDNKPYKAIYSQFSQLLLAQGDNRWNWTNTNGESEHFYAITVKRSLYKDRIDPANWELTLSGSGGGSYSALTLTDDSGQGLAAPLTGSSRMYNIVSGTIDLGAKSTTAADHYGFFYPDMGIMILDAGAISSSIGYAHNYSPGATLKTSGVTNSVAHHNFYEQLQLGSMHVGGNGFKARAEEDVTSTHYFCRIHNNEYNFSNNKTWATGSDGTPTNPGFTTDPKTYITSVGLYNDARELLAVAKLSKPLLKSFSKESVIKVKLDF